MLALPKIIRLRDSRYLKLLEKSIRDNLEAVDGFLISSLEHVGLLQQWDFLQSKRGTEIMVCIFGIAAV